MGHGDEEIVDLLQIEVGHVARVQQLEKKVEEVRWEMGECVGWLITTLSPRAKMSGSRKGIRVQQGCIGSSIGTDHKFARNGI